LQDITEIYMYDITYMFCGLSLHMYKKQSVSISCLQTKFTVT